MVVEAGRRSGTRNTAATAAELGRLVMAVPGPVTSAMSVGCHDLLRTTETHLVTTAAEVAEVIGPLGDDPAPNRSRTTPAKPTAWTTDHSAYTRP